MKFRIGVISDTHGQLHPQIHKHFQGVDLITHAGDIGSPRIIKQLNTIAKVEAVLGNTDTPYYYPNLTKSKTLQVADRRIHLIHIIDLLDIEPVESKTDIIIFGHSHKPTIKKLDNVLYFNPGSAGPRRFDLPVSLGVVEITRTKITGKHILLES